MSNGTQHVCRHITPQDSVERLAEIVNKAFIKLEKTTGFPERLSQFAFSLLDVESLIDSAIVAEWNNELVGVCFLSAREDSNVRAISLIAVDPEYQKLKVGRNLLENAIELAKSEGATSIRLVVNAHSTHSFPLYAFVGFQAKEPMSLVTLAPDHRVVAPSKHYEDELGWKVRPMTKSDLPAIKALSDDIVGFNRIQDTEFWIDLYEEEKQRQYRPWVLEIPQAGTGIPSIAAYITGLTWDNYSVAVSADHWKYLAHYVLYHYFDSDCTNTNGGIDELPHILIPIMSQPHIFSWVLNALKMRVEKNELLMAYGEYRYTVCPEGIYMPGVEF